MTSRDVPVHYLRGNKREYTPAAVIFADTETRTVEHEAGELLALRCWAATYHDRRTTRGARARHDRAEGTDALALARQVHAWTTGRRSVWLFTHNLGFDLSTTRLPMLLCQLGWQVTDAAVGGKSPWFRLARRGHALTLVDAWSWLPYPLADIAARTGMTKPPLPADDDSPASWLARCWADVEILDTAMNDLLAWWDQHQRGNWSLTGPASGWNAMRHTPTPHRVTINPDPDQMAHDRSTVHGGRRGTWRIGEGGPGPFAELDFVAAYPTIAAHLPLPVRRAYAFNTLPADDYAVGADTWGITARCEINCDTARFPVRIGPQTWYPVGQYLADLAGPDIVEARRLGALVRIGPGWAHQLAPALAPWARWCLDTQHGAIPGTPVVAQLAAKQWGRAVIGKWSARGFDRVRLGLSPGRGWGYEPGRDATSGTPGGMVDLDGQRWWISEAGTPENSYPAIHAWVEAAVRVRLGRAIAALGEAAILQCDTDGMIVRTRLVGTPAAHGHLVAPAGLGPQARLTWCLDQIEPVISPLVLRVKSRPAHVHILGPQHVQTDAQRRFAGMPKSATETGPDTYTATMWPSLQWQLEHGSPAGYVRPRRTFHVSGPYPTGWILSDRTVVPVETTIDRSGQTVIVAWPRTRYAAAGLVAADVQHAALDPYR